MGFVFFFPVYSPSGVHMPCSTLCLPAFWPQFYLCLSKSLAEYLALRTKFDSNHFNNWPRTIVLVLGEDTISHSSGNSVPLHLQISDHQGRHQRCACLLLCPLTTWIKKPHEGFVTLRKQHTYWIPKYTF